MSFVLRVRGTEDRYSRSWEEMSEIGSVFAILTNTRITPFVVRGWSLTT